MSKKTIQYQELLNVVRSLSNVGKDNLFYFFLSACENGSLQICQICLDAGADINITESRYGHTLLYKLAENGKFTTEVADWLIEKGADINLPIACGLTNLTISCYKGNFESAKYFIDKGMKITKEDLSAAVYGKNYEIVKMFLELEDDLKDDNYSFFSAIEDKQTNIVELFLQKGATPNFYFGKDITPLHQATLYKDIQTAQILLKYNASVNAKLKADARFVYDGGFEYRDPFTGISIGSKSFALTPMDIAVINQDISMQKLLTSFGGFVSSKEEKIQALSECSNNEIAISILKKILAS